MGSHDGGTACHGLEKDQSHAVVAGWDNDNVGSSKVRRRIGAEADQIDPAVEPQCADLTLNLCPVRAVSDQPQSCRRRAHPGQSGNGDIRCSLIGQAPDAHDERLVGPGGITWIRVARAPRAARADDRSSSDTATIAVVTGSRTRSTSRYSGDSHPPTSHDHPCGVKTLGGRLRPKLASAIRPIAPAFEEWRWTSACDCASRLICTTAGMSLR